MRWRVLAIISVVVGAIVCWTTARNIRGPARPHDAVWFDPYQLETARGEFPETSAPAELPKSVAWWDVPIGTRPPVRTPPRPRVRSPWRPPPR